MNKEFKALLVENQAIPQEKEAPSTVHPGLLPTRISTLSLNDLPDGEVLVQVMYSSINYKDGLAAMANSSVIRSYPMIPGIDLSGVVVSSKDSRYKEGDSVLATGYEIGVSHYGGFSQYARLRGDWLVPLPVNLTLREAMIYGTAGFTAALSLHRLEQNGVSPSKGAVLVTGATGGVGSTAVSLLHTRGYEVTASTGKAAEHDYLTSLGATEVLSREQVHNGEPRALDKQRWQAAIDPVGGASLVSVLGQLKYNGSAAVSGLTGGEELPATVYPFILRGINLLGIDSVYCPMDIRKQIWQRLAADLKPAGLELMVDKEIPLQEVPTALNDILNSRMRGRVIVNLSD